ncbi:molybdenum cofactor guanylyltransferase [Aliifodinibius sp. S!AR15-10]|uniref:molybdenum cofactor guanylyltransferase n=1 Tax=Aliifodinibius sp. S!AR15-10 TaxID=2950437 RepID=UPI002860CAFB|nr:molybdenum cofactor guanylyltransferase [Aliifodinibius sp. S!AR15-10]MDR8390742.1 molybdenum cofactor guanylyltransferase [Aliifodinibius sp. S!AR15-10]
MNAYILAGGMNQRFGGDKALYRYRGKSLITYPADRFAAHFNNLVIIAKDSAPYTDLKYIVLEDLLSYKTPLAGIYTGLCHTDIDWNFFLACDMPLITLKAVDKLARTIPRTSANCEVIIPRSPEGLQPLAAFYHKSLADVFMKTAEQVRSLKDFLLCRSAEIVDFESDKPFTNVNSREQLKHLD